MIKNIDPTLLNKQTSFNVQDKYKHLSAEELKEVAKSLTYPFAVALANISGDLNIGNCVRTSAVFGAEKVFIFGRRKWDRRSAVGGNNYVPVDAHTVDTDPFDWDSALQVVRVNGYRPVLFETVGKPLSEYPNDFHHGKPCLVFGPEGFGIPKSICEKELCYYIPQRGVLRSLNVASAAAIAIQYISGIVASTK